MRDGEPQRRARGIVAYMLLLGALIGAIAGDVEGLATLLTGRTTMSPGGIVDLALLYAVVFGALGVVLGLLAWAAMRLRRRPEARRERHRFGALLLATTVFVFVGGYANELFLPEIASREALAFDAVLLVVCVMLWLTAFRVLTRTAPRSLRPRRVPAMAVVAAVVVALLLGTSAVELSRGRGPRELGVSHERGPNVLLLVVDAMRADHLGLYGYDRETSPNIDRLGSEGVVFTNAYAQGSRTKETTASLITSLYPSTHQVYRLPDAVPATFTTLAESFRGGGYRTAVFSANPLVSPVFGFGDGVDHFYCDLPPVVRQAIVPIVLTKLRRRVVGVQRILNVERRLERLLPFSRETVAFEGASAVDLNRRLIDWIEAEDSPFFAYVHYMEPHVPYAPPPPYDRLFDPDYEGERLTQPPVGPGFSAVLQDGSISPRAFENLLAQYDGSIAHFDAELGRLLEELRTLGLEDETLLVITADHGEEFLDHGAWSHGHSLHQELIKVPLILWGQPIATAPRVVREPVRHIDLMPTLLSAAGLATRASVSELAGADLWPALEGLAEFDAEVPAVAELFRSGCRSRSLVWGDMKVILNERGSEAGVLLFDLARDPGERFDIANEHPDVVRSLLDRLASIPGEPHSRTERPVAKVIDESTREKLEALGYTM